MPLDIPQKDKFVTLWYFYDVHNKIIQSLVQYLERTILFDSLDNKFQRHSSLLQQRYQIITSHVAGIDTIYLEKQDKSNFLLQQ